MGGAIKNAKLDFFVESYLNFKYVADGLWWRLRATPHLEEPRCEYLRTGDPRERLNERTDWAHLHQKFRIARAAEKASLRKTARNRAAAQAWLKRHHPAKFGTGKGGSTVARRR